METDELYQYIKTEQEKLRWAGLSSNPDYVQKCYKFVESNAKRIDEALETVSEFNTIYDAIIRKKDVFLSKDNEESWNKTLTFKQTIQEIVGHFCEILDVQSNFLLMNKSALISQNNAEKALIYRHIQVDLVRAFQRLHYIDEYIRENDTLFSVEMQRRECNKQKGEINKKYGIKNGALRDARNKMAAHWDKEVDYFDMYERSKTVSCDHIREICIDLIKLAEAYSHCLRDALNNYMESVKKDSREPIGSLSD